jgi:hypothetical protein
MWLQELEHMPSKHKALKSIPSTAKEKRRKTKSTTDKLQPSSLAPFHTFQESQDNLNFCVFIMLGLISKLRKYSGYLFK